MSMLVSGNWRFIIRSWESLIASHLSSSPDQSWRSSGDHVSCWQSHYTCNSSRDSTYWLHGCMERLQQTHCPSFISSSPTTIRAMPISVLGFNLPLFAAIFAHFFHQGPVELRRRSGLVETDAENSPTAGTMKTLISRKCDHKGCSELDTSRKVWSRVFIPLHREEGEEEVMMGVRRVDLGGCNGVVGVNRPRERGNSRDCHQLSPWVAGFCINFPFGVPGEPGEKSSTLK